MKPVQMRGPTLATLALVVLGALAVSTGAGADAAADGPELFRSAKCATCHSVASAGIEAKAKPDSKLYGGDLTGALAGEDLDQIARYLRKEAERDGEEHKKETDLPDEDLRVLLDWLVTQTGDEAETEAEG